MTAMAQKQTYQEVRGKLGLFGWVWRILLAIWQALMIGWFVSYLSAVAPMVDAGGAKGAGAVLGGTIGVGFIVAIWVGGTVIFGLFVLLTRRTKALVPVPLED